MKANDQNIKLYAEFHNIGFGEDEFSPIIFHDEHRVK